MRELSRATIGPFRGINNRLPDFALRSDAGDFLRSALNVDVDDAGRLRRRIGQTRIQVLSAPHSLYETTDGRFFVVIGGVLYRITLPAYTQAVVKVLASNSRTYYAEHNGDVYYSNGTDSGRVSAAGTWYPWALPTPSLPAVTPIAGSLPPGKYLVAVAYSNVDTGEEGGARGSTQYELSSPGALRVTLPTAVVGATHVNVYVSSTNGGIPCLHGSAAVGEATYDVTTLVTTLTCAAIGLGPLPAGTGLFVHLGRLGVISAGDIFYSEPWRPGYCRPYANFIGFEESVSIVVPAQNGCYIVADKTRWFAGDLANPSAIVDVLPYKAVPGTGFESVSDMTVGWFSSAGVVIASPAGEAVAAMADSIDLSAPASGASCVISDGGYERAVSCGWSINLANKATTQHGNFAYTSFAGGYGTKADGIYQLSGDTDDGAKIDSIVDLGRIDFGTPDNKRLMKMRLGAESDQPLVATISTPDRPDGHAYEARWMSGDLREQTITVGKGLSASWFGVVLENTLGAPFVLASSEVNFAVMTRRN